MFAANLGLLLQSREDIVVTAPQTLLADEEGSKGGPAPYAGMYTYPGFGQFFLSSFDSAAGHPPPLTMVVFLSSETACPANLSETEVLRRIIPSFRSRGHLVLAAADQSDSADVVKWLQTERLEIPLVVADSAGGSLHDLGISPHFMPFKVLYDSTLTAIYMRGADNTPESQLQFESAAIRISSAVASGWR
ncbi:MAG: hypothetical protein AB1752_12005 [Candidatus Zixiibacteriota bacterium]